MTGLRLWLRRGLGTPLAVLIAAFVLISLLTQQQWRLELDWATRLSAASVLVTTPFVAAAAAFDTGRRFRPTLAHLTLGAARHRLQVLTPGLAITVWAVLAYVVVWVVAALIVTAHDGVGVTDWWVFAEIAAPLLAAGLLGTAVAMLLPSSITGFVAAPVAAVTVLAGTVAASPWGRGPFEAVTTFGTLTGLQRPAVQAVATIAAALVLALLAAVAAREAHRPAPARRGVLAACTALVLTAALAPAVWPWREGVYVVSNEPVRCVGSAPAVCGPASRTRLLVPVQTSLAKAYRTLAGTDFTRPAKYTVTRLDHYADLDGAAPLDFDPTLIHHTEGGTASYARSGVLAALLRPHQCREVFTAQRAPLILDAQDRVRPWLDAVLAGQTPARPVPTAVQSAFDVIADCDVVTGNL
ncbi:hypothetical protein [Kineococcus arenarius]|uniref:hypothetical protein n=1 Tax=Kineococcus sp. SYSU DK007 TaxID=3383128 RepID=UPI003D7D9D83